MHGQQKVAYEEPPNTKNRGSGLFKQIISHAAFQ